ncbi:PDR/VanB family oxidoreductase [Pseudomonas sp. MMS21-TM103]|uniref:PDR/VanB family oxidoreductase n=1 Tax=Pseudomonas sp. MMS21 TM103 TaxID=2886506 RepID=UPI001EDF7D52|nr:PDR/VanB family oxidoreductase [Pseudomonas sp. MMS21 TM103]MCG4454931.1 PDR/VanB family oxidoreductase [Pseudomonas sp. MMS21 TM103]
MGAWNRARVKTLQRAAHAVLDIQLVADDGQPLPEAQAGSHIDVRLPNGLIRQYSIHEYSFEAASYSIGVGLSEPSRGGSAFIHERLEVGDVLEIGAPRNNFPIEPGARSYLFIAGGIGITPILSMIRWCAANSKPWALLYCVRSRARAAYIEYLPGGGKLVLHADDEQAGRPDLQTFLRQACADDQVYCCGPALLMDAVGNVAQGYLPSAQVHFELFSAPESSAQQDGPNKSFIVELAQSGFELTVPADSSLLDVLEAAGILVPYSCREGLCRTCECEVLEGEVDHRDYVLSDAERASNKVMLQCVSRAKSEKLVLDL